MSAANSAELPPQTPPDSASPERKRHWFRAWGMPVIATAVLGGILLCLLLLLSDTPYGRAPLNLATWAAGGALVLTLAAWFSFFSYYSRQTVLLVMIPLLLVTVGWAGSIRLVKFDGDMSPTFFYRWDQPVALQAVAGIDADNANAADSDFSVNPGDMPAFRGPRRDGIVNGPALNQNWQADPPPELWRTPVGAGYASMAVGGNRLITIEQRDGDEAITCYDINSGKLKWVQQYPARFFEAMGGLGPRSTPTIDDGKVFVMGATGIVTAVDYFTGALLWQRKLHDEFQIPNVTWGMASSPLVLGSQVIVNPGGPAGNGLMSLDRETGETLWQNPGVTEFKTSSGAMNLSGYSSPMLEKIAGVEQILMFDGAGLSGHDPQTGVRWWHFPFQNGAGVNAAQPIVLEDGQRILISASYGMGSALVEVQQKPASETEPAGWDVRKIWHVEGLLRSKFANPVFYEGHVYGLDEGILSCIDPTTGDKLWKQGRYKHGQVLLSNGQLLVMAEDGDLVLVQPDPAGLKEVTRMTVLPGARVWNQHSLVNGIVYVRDDVHMAAFDLRADRNALPETEREQPPAEVK